MTSITGRNSDGEPDWSDDEGCGCGCGGCCNGGFCSKKIIDNQAIAGEDDIGIGGDDGVGDSNCCITHAIEIEDLRDRMERFKLEMEDDITLIFARIDDRIEDMLDRIYRLE